jgi:hypothetical protein
MCAWCYVCDSVITYGGLSTGITQDQLTEVLTHRAGHWEDARQIIAPKSP